MSTSRTLRSARPARTLLVLLGSVGLMQPAAADLISVPNQTQVQQNISTGLQNTCVGLLGLPSQSLTTPQQQLLRSCTRMVVTGSVITGTLPDGSPPPSGLVQEFDLGISEEELRRGVQAIGPGQMNAQKQPSTEASRSSLIQARLLDIRGGARGFLVSVNGLPANSTGGAASADPELGGRWGAFVNLSYNRGDVDRTARQDAYDFYDYGALVGLDYRLTENFVLGAAVSHSYTKSEFERSLGEVEARTTGLGLYSTYYIGSWFVDGFLSYGDVRYDTLRIVSIPSNTDVPAINARAKASPDGKEWTASLGFGYDYVRNAATVTPFLRVGYIRVRNDAFAESEPVEGLGLTVDERTVKSLQSALGARLSTNVSTGFGVLVPYLAAQWVHEFENDNPSIVAKYVNDPFNNFFVIPTEDPDRDYATITAGTSAQFANDLSAFIQIGTAVFLDDVNTWGVVLGLRRQF